MINFAGFGFCPELHQNIRVCFNAALTRKGELIDGFYSATFPAEEFDLPAYFRSAFEHPLWPVLKQGALSEFRGAVWGLIPHWTKTADKAAAIRDRTINARFETIGEKPSFRGLVDRNRCGVLVDGFVEWRSFDKKKYPYHIAMPEKRPFLLAGLWDRWSDPESDSRIETFSVVTVEAQGILREIHNTKLRMPLILSRDSGAMWLDGDRPFGDIRSLIRPLYSPLQAWPVSRRVSIPGENKNLPEIQDPVDYLELPPLKAVP